MTSWGEVPEGSEFGVQNLPYGVFSRGSQAARVGVRIGEFVLDLAPALADEVFAAPSLNGFLARGRAEWTEARRRGPTCSPTTPIGTTCGRTWRR